MFSIYPSSNYQQLIEFNLNHPEKPIPDYDPYHKFETIQSKLIEIYEGINWNHYIEFGSIIELVSLIISLWSYKLSTQSF